MDSKDFLTEQEERLSIVARATNDVIWDWDLRTDRIWWNEGITRLFGYEADEIGTDTKWWAAKIHPDDRIQTMQSLEASIADRRPWSAEYRFQRRDGSYAWLRDQGFLVREENERPVRMMGAMIDITRQKEAEDQLRAAERKYRTLIEQLPTIVYKAECDPGGRWFYVSPQIEQLLGYTPEFWINTRRIWYNSLHREDRDRVAAQESRSKESGTPFRSEYRIYDRHGALHWFRDEAFVERDAEGNTLYLSGIILDITQSKQSEEELRKSEERYRSLVKQSSEGIYIFDPVTKRIQEANLKFLDMLGYTEEEITKLTIYDIIKADKESVDANVERAVSKGKIHIAIRQYLHKSGQTVDVEIHASLVSYGDSKVMLVNIADVSERKRAEALQSALYRVAEKTTSALDLQEFYAAMHSIVAELMYAKNFYIALYDPESGLINFPYFVDEVDHETPPSMPLPRTTLTAYILRTGQPSLITPERFTELIKQDEVEPYGAPSVDWMGVPLRSGDRTFGVLVVQSYDPSIRYRDSDLEVLTFVSQHIASALERKRAEETIRHQAYHDPLTHLPNRMLFRDRFQQALARAKRNDEKLAMLFMDLDRFKVINDTLGHAAGDRLLQIVAERLRASVREGDTIARLGGDEFMLLLSSLRTAEDAAKVGEKMLAVVRPPIYLDNHELYVTTSIGISIYPFDGEDAEVLVKHADIALYRAKEQGRDNYQIYSPAMNVRALEILEMENRLRRAVERKEFEVYYQPMYRVDTGDFVSTEALLRWQRDKDNMILPGEFISIAEDTGLILPIGQWTLESACRQTAEWQKQGLPRLSVCVNISARQFQQNDLIDSICKILLKTGLDPKYLELELTESTILKNASRAVDTLHSLKQMGIRICIDDFGTGYSSLSYLRQLPIDTIKIDQSFVRDCVTNPEDASIVAAIISMAHSLKLTVVGEGVETQEQLEFLKSLHCDVVQGFFTGIPSPHAEILKSRGIGSPIQSE